VVVDHDHSPRSTELIQKFDGSPFFDLIGAESD